MTRAFFLILLHNWSHYFFKVLILFKNCFNKSIRSLFTSINNNWITKFIINRNKLVRKTAKNAILIFFCVKAFIAFNAFRNTLKISIKWNWYLSRIIFEPNKTTFNFIVCLPFIFKQMSLCLPKFFHSKKSLNNIYKSIF